MGKFKPFRVMQKSLIEVTSEMFLDYINGLIPEDHLCRLVKEVVFSIDTRKIEEKYSHLGQNSYHPKLMLSLLIYGYATGVRSSRKLAEKCISDNIYIYLVQDYKPDYRTISDFRKDNVEELEKYFVEVVRILQKLGVIKIGKIYIDGTKVKANASVKRTRDEEGYKKWLGEIEEEIKELVEEAERIDRKEEEECKEDEEIREELTKNKNLREKIKETIKKMKEEDKGKINLTDHEARNMKAGGSKDIRPGYNCQAGVSEEGVIVVAEAVAEANDCQQLENIIEKAEKITEEPVKEVIADSGYGSYSNYEYVENKGIEGYIPDDHFQHYKRGEYKKEENHYHYSNFKYDMAEDRYICPEGEYLTYWKTRIGESSGRVWNHKVYRGMGCGGCAKHLLCTKGKVRELLIDNRDLLLQKMRNRLLSKKGEKEYSKRAYIIEPIFGHLKFNLGYRNFLLRGLEKVRAEFKLMCIGWNIKKMLTLGIKPAMI